MAMKRIIAELPSEIMYDILIHLPVRSLCRFRCVCKSWGSLISSPPFQQDHYRIFPKNPRLFITKRRRRDKKLIQLSTYNSAERVIFGKSSCKKIPRLSEPKSFYKSVTSCRGLVCIADNSLDITLLCNPSTEQLIVLPECPARNFLCIGLGYCPATEEFKVVKFYNNYTRTTFCKVLTVGASHWIDVKFPQNVWHVYGGHATFLHGSFHLMTRDQQDNSSCFITAVDIDSEEYREIPAPIRYYSHCDRLMELGGTLCIISIIGDIRMKVWLLKDYNSEKCEWFNKYNFNFSSVAGRIRNFATSDEENIWVNANGPKGKEFICYNIRDEIVTQRIYASGRGCNVVSALLYVESFEPLLIK